MLARTGSVLGLLAFTWLVSACEPLPGEEAGGYETFQAAAAGDPLEIDFTAKPAYIPNNVIVLTFDDGPDTVNTPKVLDILKEKGVKATFFINTINFSNVDKEPAAQAIIKRIVAEGHELANHTIHHPHLATLSPSAIEMEVAGVEQSVAKIFGANGPKLTLLRAPYGEPYTDGNPNGAKQKLVSGVVSKHAVHIGWAIDTLDWQCKNADCVFNNLKSHAGTPGNGDHGVVLMHSVHPQTVGGLPRVIDYLKMNGFVFKLTEDVVRLKFGKSSAELLGVPSTGGGGQGGTGGTPETGGTGGEATGGSSGGDGGSGAGGEAGGTSGGTDAGGVDTAGGDGGSGAGGEGGQGGTPVKEDAGAGPAAGGKSGGTGGKSGGTAKGGSSGATTPEDPMTAMANGGGCSYGGAPEAPALGLMLVVGGLMVARRKRRF